MTEKKTSKTDLEIIDEAKKRAQECLANQSALRANAKEELLFGRKGEQWTDEDKKLRDGRPCLTINKTNTFINYEVNEIKQNKPKIKVRPFDDKTDISKAEVVNGIIAHILKDSNADGATDWAASGAVSCGLGYLRIISEFIDKSFEQKLLIKRIANYFSVLIPFHLCDEEDFSDMPYAIIVSKISKKDYETKYGDNPDNWESPAGDLWLTEKNVTIAEYFTKTFAMKTFVELSNGEMKYKDELPESLPDGITITREREEQQTKIKWYKLSSSKILEQTDWPGKYIPVIAIMGQEVDVDGEKDFISLTRFAKDPQKSFNYLKSKEAEVIGLAPISPWIISEGQLGDGDKNYGKMWAQSNTTPYGALVYKSENVNGTLVPPPKRTDNLQIPTAFVNAAQEANADMKETIGLWSANLGAQGNETSGVAIRARSNQGSLTNFHFMDNTIKGLKFLGKQLVDLIPKYYNTARAVRILGEDKKEEIVTINQPYVDKKTGKEVLYNMSTGTYDIVVDVGANFATRRQELETKIGELMERLPPNMAAAISDLFVRSMDIEYSSEMADRLKKLVPPEVLQKEGEISPAIFKKMQVEIQEWQKKEGDLLKIVGAQQEEIDNKDKELKSKYDIAALNASKDLEIASMKSSIDELKVHHAQTQAFLERMIAQDNAPKEPEPAPSAENTPPQGE